MAKKTFTVSAIGSTAGQTLDAGTTGIQWYGEFNGCIARVEVSHNGTNWSPLVVLNELSTVGRSSAYAAITVPSGWQVRIFTEGAVAPAATVVIE